MRVGAGDEGRSSYLALEDPILSLWEGYNWPSEGMP